MTLVMNIFLSIFLLLVIANLATSDNEQSILIRPYITVNNSCNCNHDTDSGNKPTRASQCSCCNAKAADVENVRTKVKRSKNEDQNNGDLFIAPQLFSNTDEEVISQADCILNEFGDNTKCQCKPIELQAADNKMVCTCISYAQDLNQNEVVPACGCKPKRLDSGECACDVITCDNICAIPYLKYNDDIAGTAPVVMSVVKNTVNNSEIEGKRNIIESKIMNAILQQDLKPDPKELKCKCEAKLVESDSNAQCECKPFVEGGNLWGLSPPCGCKIKTSILINGSLSCECIPFSCGDVSEKMKETSTNSNKICSCESSIIDDTPDTIDAISVDPEARLGTKPLCSCQTINEGQDLSTTEERLAAKPLCSCQSYNDANDLSSNKSGNIIKPLCSCNSYKNDLDSEDLSLNSESNFNEITETSNVNVINTGTGNKPLCSCNSYKNNNFQHNEVSSNCGSNVNEISYTSEQSTKNKPLCSCGSNYKKTDFSLAAKPLCKCDSCVYENTEVNDNSNNLVVEYRNKPHCNCLLNHNAEINSYSSERSTCNKPLCSCQLNDATDGNRPNTESVKPVCGRKTKRLQVSQPEVKYGRKPPSEYESHNKDLQSADLHHSTPDNYNHNVEVSHKNIKIKVPIYATDSNENFLSDEDENNIDSLSYEDRSKYEPRDDHIRRSKIKINENAFDYISKALSKFASFSKKFAMLTPKLSNVKRRARKPAKYGHAVEVHVSNDRDAGQRKYFKYDKDLPSSCEPKQYKHKRNRKSYNHDKHKSKRNSEDKKILAYDRNGNYKVYELF